MEKGKGALKTVIALAVIGLCFFVACVGMGEKRTGAFENIRLGLDLAGGVSITYQVVDKEATKAEIDDTVYKMQRRADSYSAESVVYLEGDDRIGVDVPDVQNAEEVLERLGNAGTIYFIPGKSAAGNVNIGVGVSEDGERKFVLARPMEDIIADDEVILDGSCITGAEAGLSGDQIKKDYIVELKLNDKGISKFSEATGWASRYYDGSGRNLENLIAIVYDSEVISAPMVSTVIDGNVASITGQGTLEEAESLATTIRVGALPLELSVLRYKIVGAKLGAEALNTSLLAGIIGFAIVALFMIVIYRLPGFASALALFMYVALVAIAISGFEITLTLPGIAGVILSVGMAVDANVVIFTRIKEELALEVSVAEAIKTGFKKALTAIIDGNVTTLLAAGVLFFMGSGTVKSFAQTLAIGIVISMFTALTVTRFIVKAFYQLTGENVKLYGIKKPGRKFDYVSFFKKGILISGTVILIGVVFLFINKGTAGEFFSYSLDFRPGTSYEVTFDEIPGGIQTKTEELYQKVLGTTAEVAIASDTGTVIAKSRELSTEEQALIKAAMVEELNVKPENVMTQSISATISDEMKRDALIAVCVATAIMLIYIWIRFSHFTFAVSAILALIHDVLIVALLYAIFKNVLPVGTNFIACLLTIVGYSINATIIIFDRIRENMKELQSGPKIGYKAKRRAPLSPERIMEVVNASISETFTRSLNTSLTTFIMVFFLAILGVSSVREFAIPLMAGIVFGGFSSVCITGPLWYYLGGRKGIEEDEEDSMP